MNKIKTLLYSLTPMAFWFLMQIIIGVLFYACGLYALPLSEAEAGAVLMITTNVITMVPCYFWYRHIRGYVPWETENGQPLRGWSYVYITALGILMQILIDFLLVVVFVVFPHLMQGYMELLEQLGMTEPAVFTIVYTIAAAPILEELIYRGLTLVILEKRFSFITANIIQALLFGIMHGNLVQGSYAFVLGMVLGLIVKRYNSLWAAIFCHFVMNLSGNLMSYIGDSYWNMLVLLVFGAIVAKIARKREEEIG